MGITRFRFEDRATGWRLDEVQFSTLNLLVGVSGAGKTRILDAIRRVVEAAAGPTWLPERASWEIGLTVEGEEVVWAGETTSELIDSPIGRVHSRSPGPVIVVERVSWGAREVLRRSGGDLWLDGERAKGANPSSSAVSLFAGHADLKTLGERLSRVRLSDATGGDVSVGFDRLVALADELRAHGTPEELSSWVQDALLLKVALMERAFPERFREVADQYSAIFPTITAVAVKSRSAGDDEQGRVHLDFAIREAGVNDWIIGSDISSGMRRTLAHLFELALSPAGTVLLIDEYEDSLGVNCLPALTEHLVARAGDLQFILTSHHPYVVNNIPREHWKVVTREGSVVTVRDALDVPGLRGASSLDGFTLLMNSPAFEEGVR